MFDANSRLPLVGTVDPQSASAGDYATDIVDMSKFQKVVFYILVGAMTTNGTLDFVVKGDSASGGSFTTTVTGKAITQFTKAGSDDNKQAVVEVTAEELAEQGFRYVKGVLTTATAASIVAVAVVGVDARYAPADDLASVDEVVA